MMDCTRTRNLFSELAEGVLDEGLRVKAEAHLADCPACQLEFSGFRAIYQHLPGAGKVEPPSDLYERIARRLDAADYERRHSSPKLGWWKFALTGAAAAAVLSYVVLNRNPVATGIEANPLSVNTNAARPLGVRIIEGKVHIQLRPMSDTVVSVYQGGTDFATLPPLDAKLLRTDKVGALSIYNVPINVDSQMAETLWVMTSHPEEPVHALFLPTSAQTNTERKVEGTLVDVLRAICQRHNVVIDAVLTNIGEVKQYDLAAPDAVAALQSVGLTVTESGGVLHVTQ